MHPVEPAIHLTPTAGEDKPLVPMFWSYATCDAALVRRLREPVEQALSVDQNYVFKLWTFDRSIVVGEDWDTQIRKALAECPLGLLAVSNAFLGSQYITDVELPALMDGPGKRLIPVAVRHVSPHANWHGLQNKQVYGLHQPFSDLRGTSAQDRWVNTLVDQIHQLLAR